MKINFSDQSSIDSVFDDELNQLHVSNDTVIEETLVRRLGDMNELFVDAHDVPLDFPLYYMYNGIYRKMHEKFFKEGNVKYEYTVLPALTFNDEFLKAHGHIHTIRPIKNTRHVEIYEILHGEGYFQMFREVEGILQVILMKVKPGDRFLIPGDYFHLSINTGKTPLIFGDLITNEAANDYGPLKVKKGAPFFAMKRENERVGFVFNPNYGSTRFEVSYVDIDSLPWENPVADLPLYAHFITHPEAFAYLNR